MFRGAMFNSFRDLWGSTSSPAIRVTPVLVNHQNHQRSSYPFLSYPQKSPVIGLDHPCFRRCDFQLDWMIMDYHGPLMDCHNSFMVHDGFLFHKWGHKLVQHIQDTPWSSLRLQVPDDKDRYKSRGTVTSLSLSDPAEIGRMGWLWSAMP